MTLRAKQSGLNRQPEGLKDELIESIERKYRQATSPADRLVVKWLGWLSVFLILPRKERIKFANDDEQVEKTREKLTQELYEFGRAKEKKRTNSSNVEPKRSGIDR